MPSLVMSSDPKLCAKTVFLLCFLSLQREVEASQECQSKTFRNMSRSHLSCLFAHAFNVTTQGINVTKTNNADDDLSARNC